MAAASIARRLPLAIAWLMGAASCGGRVEGERDAGTRATPRAQQPAATSGWGAPDPEYSCTSTSAGFACTCPSIWPDSPTVPLPTGVVMYSTTSDFDALAVGRWKRTSGRQQLQCEQVGVEITADHYFYPLVVAADGTVHRVDADALGPFQLSTGATALVFNGGNYSTGAPEFHDPLGGSGIYMSLPLNSWSTDYVKMP